MTKVSLDPLSYTAFPIKLYAPTGELLATATGFYWQIDNVLWLITNWHNLTGFDPDTGKRKENATTSPVVVAVPVITKTTEAIKWSWCKVPLYENESPKWLVHPSRCYHVDVVAIEVGENVDENAIQPINLIKWDKECSARVADDVYILGFPYGMAGGGNFPIWKRATIASEPDIDVGNLPQVIVDTTTRTGMSGSPVIIRRDGIHGLVDDKLVDSSIIGEIQGFLGIYSGRFYADEQEETQLGRVWKKQVIEEIIEGTTKDDGYYPNISDVTHK